MVVSQRNASFAGNRSDIASARLLLAIFVAVAKSLPAHLVAGLGANSFGWQRSARGVNIALRAYAHRED
jgi:hypothetical protein